MKLKWFLMLLVLGLIILLFGYFYFKKLPKKSNPNQTPPAISTPSMPKDASAAPIADFKSRITKKPFGIYITPQNSPVQPEKFTGYHTGVDVEYQDVTQDVPVYVISEGTVVSARTVSGYGGVVMLDFSLAGQEYTALYGHLRPSSLSQVGQKMQKGEAIGLLGTGYSIETDGERRHLHLAILSDNRIDLRGYVQKQSELSDWLDPLSFFGRD